MIKKFNVWLNAVLFYSFFSFLGLKIQIIERIASFFAPYVLLFIPRILTDQNQKTLRTVYWIIIVVGFIAYNYVILNDSGYDPYYFIG